MRPTHRILIVSFLTCVAPTVVAAQSVDSLAALLSSPELSARQVALMQLARRTPAQLAAVAPRIIALLDAEAGAPGVSKKLRTPDSLRTGEEFGDYLIQLSSAAVATHDARAVRGLAYLGTTSLKQEKFIASYGSAAISGLDDAWTSKPDVRDDLMDIWGLMMAADSPRLPSADRGRIMTRILSAATDSVMAYPISLRAFAQKGRVVSLSPLLRQIADTSSIDIVKEDAREGTHALDSIAATRTSAALLDDFAGYVKAICGIATAANAGACGRVVAHLDEAARQVAGGDPTKAKAALHGASDDGEAAFRQGAFSRLERDYVTGNVAMLVKRLAP
jgi:hypothetical protein